VHLHLESTNETLLAVTAGAVLATVGGFMATQLEALMRRRERERSAALLFGEILSAIETIAAIAGQARLRGEPYGPWTLRLIGAAQRETETYGANRAVLYDIRDAEIRIKMHVLMVQITLALQGVSDASTRISTLQDTEKSAAAAAAADNRLADLSNERDAAFQAVVDAAARIGPLVRALQPIAKVDFESLKRFSGNPVTGANKVRR
jgi:hypothetical protein